MDNRRVALLAAIAAFIAAGVGLSRCADDATEAKTGDKKPAQVAERKKVVYPRDVRRVRRRPELKGPKAPDAPRAPRRDPANDPIVRALSGPGEGGAVFVEVNAIRHSDVVEKMLACRQTEAFSELERMKEDLGLDLTKDVDRFALGSNTVAVSGFFDELKLPPALGAGEAYGNEAKIYRTPEGAEGGGVLAVVGGNLLVMGESEEEVQAAVDRAEGREPPGSNLPPELFHSEVYGKVGPDLLRSVLSTSNDPLAAQLMELVDESTVRMMFDDQVSLSLDLSAKTAEAGEDLAKAVGGALAGLRREAEQEGEQELAWLLEQARVLPGDNGRFGIDLAVPGELILKSMGCDAEGQPLARETLGDGDEAAPNEPAPGAPAEPAGGEEAP